jgi:hypothetical protein
MKRGFFEAGAQASASGSPAMTVRYRAGHSRTFNGDRDMPFIIASLFDLKEAGLS